ncbi:hypothetical protein FRC17_000101 [Serendipita sp. 399]|nr:hypothetical protein FRC17_000101 [Serendipita sp. 399]
MDPSVEYLSFIYDFRNYHSGEEKVRVERQLHKRQAKFSKLLRICKTLYPLVEEILWSSIHLFMDTVPRRPVIEAALGAGTSRRPRGEWTRELWVTFVQPWKYNGPPQPWSIYSLFTNLRDYTLNIHDYRQPPSFHDESLFRSDDQAADRASKITSLSLRLKMMGEEEIQFLAKWFTSLQRLTIWVDHMPEPEVQAVATFPVLRHLSVTESSRYANHLLMVMSAPQLESLCVERGVRGSGGLEFFLGAKHTLVSLFATSIFFFPYKVKELSMTAIIYALPKLQSLDAAFDPLEDTPGTVHPDLLAMQNTVFPLEDLRLTVYYLFNKGSSLSPEELPRFLKYYFPSDWFPHIKRIVLKADIMIEDKNCADRAAHLEEAVESAMPQAEVTWLDPPESHRGLKDE